MQLPIQPQVRQGGVEERDLLEVINREFVPLMRLMRDGINSRHGAVRLVSSSREVALDEEVLFVDASAGAVDLTLPAPLLWTRHLLVVKVDDTSNAITLTPASGLINSAASYSTSGPARITSVASDGTGYWASNGGLPRGATIGEVLTWDGTNWTPSTPGIGAIEHLDTTYDPVALYLFEESLADSSGNGFDLTVESGTEAYGDIAPLKLGFYFASTRLIHNTFQSLLAITGDMSIITTVQLDANFTDVGAIVAFGGNIASDTTANNYLYHMRGVSGVPRMLRWFSEQAAGADSTYTITGARGLGVIHNLLQIGVRRESNVIQFFANGRPLGPASSALATPTDGSSGRLRLGGDSGANTNAHMMFDLGIYASALTNNQFGELYNGTLGQASGLVSLS